MLLSNAMVCELTVLADIVLVLATVKTEDKLNQCTDLGLGLAVHLWTSLRNLW